MTLIVSVATPEFVFQVSDRQLTYDDETHPDPVNKAVLYCNEAIFAYTGRAALERKETHHWIAEQLNRGNHLGDGLIAIKDRLDKAYERPTYNQPTTIVSTGFARQDDGSVHPFYALVTNNIGPDNRWMGKHEILPSSVASWNWIPPNSLAVYSAPDWITQKRCDALLAELLNASVWEEMVDLVVNAMREVAAQHHEVGADLMLSILPKDAFGQETATMLTGGPPPETAASFYYLPKTEGAEIYSPTFVCNGFTMGGMSGTVLFTPEQKEIAEEEALAFYKESRPQHLYIVPVETTLNGPPGRETRSAVIPDGIHSQIRHYHPTEDLCLIAVKESLDGFPELTTLEEVETLLTNWGGPFNLDVFSKVTGIGWPEDLP